MKKQDIINNYIPGAMKAIKEVGIANEEGIVQGVYESYIAGFGASIRQSGLLPTLIFFNNNEGKQGESSKWLRAILYVLEGETTDDDMDLIQYVIKKTKKTEQANYRQTDLDLYKLHQIQSDIEHIVSALKLAVRTFNIAKDE
ncbi:MAG: type III-B CRISPR module-associated protein Cmr5 [Bacteroidetes bacterium]|nr:MAG: type III-B CRISPR module-associated protein Cmr5 [Bacteroidota bacterium]